MGVSCIPAQVAAFVSYQTNYTNANIRIDRVRHRIKLPKAGWVRYAADGREIPDSVVNVTVIKMSSGKYFASVLCEVAIELLPVGDKEIGIGMGLKKFAILSTGEVIENPRYYVRVQKKLAKLQRAFSK